MVVREQRENIQSGQTRYKRFEDESGAGMSVSRGGAGLNSEGIQAAGVRGGSHSVNSRDTAGGSPKSESFQEL